MNLDDRTGSGHAGKNEKTTGSDVGANYNQDDIATKEEYANQLKYFYYDLGWTYEKTADYFTKRLQRARLPEDSATGHDRIMWFLSWPDAARHVMKYMVQSNLSTKEIGQEFKKRFDGLEKRYDGYYRQRFEDADVVCRGTSVDELDRINNGTWSKFTRNKPDRRWADVSTNRAVAQEYA